MKNWVKSHGLSLVLIFVIMGLQVAWHTLEPRPVDERWADWCMSVGTELMGALFLVLATKRWREDGSAEGR